MGALREYADKIISTQINISCPFIYLLVCICVLITWSVPVHYFLQSNCGSQVKQCWHAREDAQCISRLQYCIRSIQKKLRDRETTGMKVTININLDCSLRRVSRYQPMLCLSLPILSIGMLGPTGEQQSHPVSFAMTRRTRAGSHRTRKRAPR